MVATHLTHIAIATSGSYTFDTDILASAADLKIKISDTIAATEPICHGSDIKVALTFELLLHYFYLKSLIVERDSLCSG